MRWKTDTYAGWGRALAATGEIARPETADAIADTTATAVGNRRSYGDAALKSGGQIVDMTRLSRLISFDTATGDLRAEAGVTIADLARIFAPKGWLPPVMPGTGFATIGGCIGMDVHGKNHHTAGSFGQHVTRITLFQDGARRTITPRNKTLWQATIGGMGQTGIILDANIRMSRCNGPMMTVTERRVESWEEHIGLLDASAANYCVGWIDATATGAALGRGILEEAETSAGPAPRTKGALKVPMDAPQFALSAPIVRAFNALYYHRIPATGRTVQRPVGDFFFPLDRIHDWNRLYGKAGFHQFQCVLPTAQKDRLRDMLDLIATSGLASPLAVLKRMGDGRAGFMSFPTEGYTLAVDFPNRPATKALIATLEEMTAAAGGRIYLAKDSLAQGPRIKAMYPDWAKWRDAVNKANPDHTLETDLIRRLSLRSET